MTDIMSLDINEVKKLVLEKGEKEYRAEQLFSWLQKGVSSFEEMTNINKSFIDILKRDCLITSCTPLRIQVSKDGTRKYLFELYDGELIESVFMEYKHGNTLCISTQVGCRMGCTFCASTKNGLKRNLLPSEMLRQITAASADTGLKISNIVLMGIGEPLDNYENVIKFLRLVNDKKGLNIGFRHISLSTCGLVNKINMLSKENIPLTLSVSLHASDDESRMKIMPVANKFSLFELMEACKNYTDTTGRRISFEYAMINGVNDRVEDAVRIAGLVKGIICHINLIPLNQIEEKVYKRSEKKAFDLFTKTLKAYKIGVTVRRSLGTDISAACGQLRAEAT